MNRESSLTKLRPKLPLTTDINGHLESFQNRVLRPILKFQNDLLLNYLYTHPQFIPLSSKINKQDPNSYREVISKFVKSNTAFRHKLYGMICGMMTVKEYGIYLKDASEYNRRIIAMYVQRVLSQVA